MSSNIALSNNDEAEIESIISELISKIELNMIKKDDITTLNVNISSPVQNRKIIVQLPLVSATKKIMAKRKKFNDKTVPINDNNPSVKAVLTRDFKNVMANLNAAASTKNDKEKPENISIESIKLMEMNKYSGKII